MQAFAALQQHAAECARLRTAWELFSQVTLRKAFLQWDAWTGERQQLASQAQGALQHWAQGSISRAFAAWAATTAEAAQARAKVRPAWGLWGCITSASPQLPLHGATDAAACCTQRGLCARTGTQQAP